MQPRRCINFIRIQQACITSSLSRLIARQLPVGFLILPPDYAILCGSDICWTDTPPDSPGMDGLRFCGVPINGCGEEGEGIICTPIDFVGRPVDNVVLSKVPFDLMPFGAEERQTLETLLAMPAWQQLHDELTGARELMPWMTEFLIKQAYPARARVAQMVVEALQSGAKVMGLPVRDVKSPESPTEK